ncbi:MAG TPA: hypothetical protein VGH26_03420 [Gaiellaceae bacterium]|jgi:hypothetical protein
MEEMRGKPASTAWSGWVGFAGWLMVLVGVIDFFEGLIAIIRGQYYLATANQIVVFNTTTWGWLTLLGGIVLLLVGYGLLMRASWARWVAIIAISVNLIGQLGFLGSAAYPLWALTVVGLTFVVLYALIVRWNEAAPLD